MGELQRMTVAGVPRCFWGCDVTGCRPVIGSRTSGGRGGIPACRPCSYVIGPRSWAAWRGCMEPQDRLRPTHVYSRPFCRRFTACAVVFWSKFLSFLCTCVNICYLVHVTTIFRNITPLERPHDLRGANGNQKFGNF